MSRCAQGEGKVCNTIAPASWSLSILLGYGQLCWEAQRAGHPHPYPKRPCQAEAACGCRPKTYVRFIRSSIASTLLVYHQYTVPSADIFAVCRCKLRTDAKVRDLYRIGRTLGTGGEPLSCDCMMQQTPSFRQAALVTSCSTWVLSSHGVLGQQLSRREVPRCAYTYIHALYMQALLWSSWPQRRPQVGSML